MSEHKETATSPMSHWNYRVRAFTVFTGVPGVEPQTEHDIVEVYYDHDDNPVAWGNSPGPLGDSVESLRDDLTAMLAALNKPVLDEDDLPGAVVSTSSGGES